MNNYANSTQVENPVHYDAAMHMISKKRTTGTIRNYQSKLNKMIYYFKIHDPECLDEGNNIKVPLGRDELLRLFGWISTNSELAARATKKKKVSDDISTTSNISYTGGEYDNITSVNNVEGCNNYGVKILIS